MSREADSILSTPPPASPASTGNLPGILPGLNAASYFNRPGVSCLMWRILSLLERCLRDNKHQGYAAFFQPSIHSFRLYLVLREWSGSLASLLTSGAGPGAPRHRMPAGSTCPARGRLGSPTPDTR